jgi:carbon-monoxide dehydrogenase medium subunit
MIALNASFVLEGQTGKRIIQADDFFLGLFKTVLKPTEILTEIHIPLSDDKTGSAYRKVKKGSGGFTIAGVAVNLSVDDKNRVSACRIAMTSVGPKVLRAKEAEQALIGKIPENAMDDVVQEVVQVSASISDLTASAEYRRKVLGILVKDAVEPAYKRAVMGKYAKS